MKFCAYLKKVDDNAPTVFRGGFLNYKALKKFIKYRARRLATTAPASYAREELALASERDIFFMLCNQLKEVDRRFEKEAGAIISEYDTLTARRRSPANFLVSLGTNMGIQKDSRAWLRVEERVAWARKFARINALALRKIAKKHDKLMHSRAGHVFLQGCWKGEAVVRCFLGGPLHAELAAVQDLLHQSAPSAAALNSSAARHSSHAQLMGDLSRDENDAGDQGHLMGTGISSSREDATCPICLDLMYEPAALACGHQFCGRCAISAAGHAETAKVQRYRDLLQVRTRDAVCPICRAQYVAQGEIGVFEAGAELPHVGQLIRQRFAEEWQERHQEAVAEQAKRAPPGRRWFGKEVSTALSTAM